MQTPIQHDGEDDEYVPLATAGGAGAVPYTPGEMSEISDLDFSPVAPSGRKKDGAGAQQAQPAQPPGPPAAQQYNPYAYMQQGSLAYSLSSQGGAPPPGWNDSGYGSYYFQQPPPPPMMMYPQGGSDAGKPAMNSDINIDHLLDEEKYSVYNARWIMLFYMSMLNLLSDWTCYSVAPIAILTIEAFGEVDPESLVTVFLGANAVASAAEPAILGRLGLRRTVLFGAALLMIGSIIKSGGSPDDDEDMTWRLYFGFFLVGLSQPLYQCTPALLSASWFPEDERTMATGVALNSNQLGIGCAFVFGTILVETKDDIIPYFGLLSVIATVMFIGAALQFDDAPPTPPSDTARVIKGDLVFKIPNLPFFGGEGESESKKDESMDKLITQVAKEEKGGELSAVNAAPSPAPTNEPVAKKFDDMTEEEKEAAVQAFMMQSGGHPMPPPPPGQYPPMPMYYPGYYGPPPPASYQQGQMQQTSTVPTFYHGYDAEGHYHNALLEADGNDYSPRAFEEDEGAEPILTQLDHHLDVDIRDDQIIQQFKACFARKGFAHCIVAFTTSGIIVNTLSTFMDYLVTLNGADKSYVGIVGGTFQLFIMFASLVFGGWTDHSRKYYFVILAMLILGAFALALCNTDLDANAGGALRWHLLIVAILAGPLQPLSTELGVEVVYPLSENTVLVIQQLFSNLLSAAFIPVFKALKDVGTVHDKNEMFEVPVFTFSFYMLIIIHACSTMYFATFNGQYLRYDAEEAKKAAKEAKKERILAEIQQTGSYGAVDEAEN
eukprot:CAMPEP_0201687840 /NCGR_PEP_ID=MMETSP0578-20130828/1715_1 /ASSEMBLY_ACC=CAM_ASM_000663 /TAXON_ID=267565 /ORGANISM="Skeletonema grethea, Strain CCMP 1804" /LENGTH=775 /DNA_ID=CAMNT_0048172019 /DNA_START=188 /DNA_END=2516 /DNA_ORIENTATION=-